MDNNVQDIVSVLSEKLSAVAHVDILNSNEATKKFGNTTFSEPVKLDAAVTITHKSQIPVLLKCANELLFDIHPVSSGRNWGYGSICESLSDRLQILLDLSALKAITPTDKDLGLITLEPGVTQQELYDYLYDNGWDYMVPVTGAGPNCSIVSNALERGYGITPYTDHFAAVTSLKGYVPHPDLCETEYCSYVAVLDKTDKQLADKSFKWGLGPYLDGLFTQSNFGIVSELTVRLAKKRQGFTSFYLQSFRKDNFHDLVDATKDVLQSFEGIVGSINLMDKRRIATMVSENPNGSGNQKVMSDEQLDAVAKQHRIPEWTMVGSIYGEPAIVKSAKTLIKKKLKGKGSLLFSDSFLIKLGKLVTSLLPVGPLKTFQHQLKSLDEGIEIMQGKPNRVALPIAYWENATITPDKASELNPARDNCGLLWYAPLLPMHAASMHKFVSMVRDITPKYHIEPLITFTNLRHDCVDSTVPILFNLQNPDAVTRAKACLNELVESGVKKGFVPYRLNTRQQQELLSNECVAAKSYALIKQSVDPNNILLPNRY
ncbi:FAD-binding protein [Aestuariibacter salexigens]|uniref:FAD-binding protein n=1 Tax=Aestuariibacter salexigens TaxID=226010 RepID=UPI0004089F11|nr:FAD-binding protein [Aestuariibacter salexigens]